VPNVVPSKESGLKIQGRERAVVQREADERFTRWRKKSGKESRVLQRNNGGVVEPCGKGLRGKEKEPIRCNPGMIPLKKRPHPFAQGGEGRDHGGPEEGRKERLNGSLSHSDAGPCPICCWVGEFFKKETRTLSGIVQIESQYPELNCRPPSRATQKGKKSWTQSLPPESGKGLSHLQTNF